jgi:hypothetical protein
MHINNQAIWLLQVSQLKKNWKKPNKTLKHSNLKPMSVLPACRVSPG